MAATLSAFAAGAVLGWTNPILDDIEKGRFHHIHVSDAQMGWIGSLVTLGGMCMCFPTGIICDLIGRRLTLLLLIIPFCTGWSLIIWANSIILLYFGRFITGMAAGACCVAAPLYTGEIAQKEIRGTLGSYFQLMVVTGILYAYIMGRFLSVIPYTISCAACVFVFFILFYFQPETPLYLIKNGKFEDAKKSLIQLRGAHFDVDSELTTIEGAVKETSQNTVSFAAAFKKKSTLKALLIAFGLMYFQQFSGINAVILYSSDMFQESGVKFDPKIATIVVAAFQVVATFVSSLVVDKLGRRMLLMISMTVMTCSSSLLGLYFTVKSRHLVDPNVLNSFGFVPTVSLCTFIVVFSLGIGPIPWMISSEIFTPDIKSICSSAASTFNWFLAFLVTKFYLDLKNYIGQDVTFYLFAGVAFVGSVFVYFIVPETKGKSPDVIQRELEE